MYVHRRTYIYTHDSERQIYININTHICIHRYQENKHNHTDLHNHMIQLSFYYITLLYQSLKVDRIFLTTFSQGHFIFKVRSILKVSSNFRVSSVLMVNPIFKVSYTFKTLPNKVSSILKVTSHS